MSILFVDLHYMLCYVASPDMLLNSSTGEMACTQQNDTLKPYIAALPSLWRLMQCFRRWFDSTDMETGKRDPTQLYNAAKYVLVSWTCALGCSRAPCARVLVADGAA